MKALQTAILTLALIGISIGGGVVLTSIGSSDEVVAAASGDTSTSNTTDTEDATNTVAPPVSPNYPAEGNTEQVQEGRLQGDYNISINTDPEMVVYLYNSNIFFPSATDKGNIKIENNPGNLAAIQASYYLVETGELIYVSPLLYPNQNIMEDSLHATLAGGVYEVNVVISAYDLEDLKLEESYYGTATIVIDEKLFGIF